MNVLFLTNWFPYPPDNGSKIRIYNLIRALAEKHDVTLVAFSDRPESEIEGNELEAICRHIHVVTRRAYNPRRMKALLGYLAQTPRSLIDTFSDEMQSCIKQTMAEVKYDIVIASQIAMARYLPSYRSYPALFEEVELGLYHDAYFEAESISSRVRNGLTWAKHIHYLKRMIKDYKACTVVSEMESKILQEYVPDCPTVRVIPNALNLNDYQEFKHMESLANTLIFTGSFKYLTNYDAMKWFLAEIYPVVQNAIPTARLFITGDHVNLPLPSTNGVELTGYVDDVRPLIAQSNLCVVPLRQGGGTRLKILEAMALGTPVVSTSKGAEGLDVLDGEHLLIADTVEEFAQAIFRLISEPEYCQVISDNAYQLIFAKYNWSVEKSRFLSLVEYVASNHKTHYLN